MGLDIVIIVLQLFILLEFSDNGVNGEAFPPKCLCFPYPNLIKIKNVSCVYIFSSLRAFTSENVKKDLFYIFKHYFIYFANPLNNICNIPVLILHIPTNIIHLFILSLSLPLYLFFPLSLYLSLLLPTSNQSSSPLRLFLLPSNQIHQYQNQQAIQIQNKHRNTQPTPPLKH